MQTKIQLLFCELKGGGGDWGHKCPIDIGPLGVALRHWPVD